MYLGTVQEETKNPEVYLGTMHAETVNPQNRVLDINYPEEQSHNAPQNLVYLGTVQEETTNPEVYLGTIHAETLNPQNLVGLMGTKKDQRNLGLKRPKIAKKIIS